VTSSLPDHTAQFAVPPIVVQSTPFFATIAFVILRLKGAVILIGSISLLFVVLDSPFAHHSIYPNPLELVVPTKLLKSLGPYSVSDL
jgi:hypothetical protein